MPATLHGARYLTGRNNSLREVILEDLPYMDFDETVRFYDLFHAARPTREDVALLGANDRYYLLTVLLNRPDALHPWLFDRSREVEANPDGYLDLWARFHYKSTIITFAGIIQELIRDPEIRIAIFSATQKIAGKFLKQIKEELQQNSRLVDIYPDVFFYKPKSESTQWSDVGINVKRKGRPKENSVSAFGLVDGMPIGSHFPLMVFDDLVTIELVSNQDIREKVTERWELSDSLGVENGTRKWHAGTRYDFADTYGTLLERQVLKPRIHAATDNGLLGGNPVLMTPEAWETLKLNQPSTVGAQMLLNPIAGKMATFKMDWLRYFNVLPATLNIYIMGDPSKGRTKESDHTAIAVIAIDSLGNKYLVDGMSHHMTLSERWVNLKRLHLKWDTMPGVQMVTVGWEQYGLVTDIEHFQSRMVDEKYSFAITELGWVREGRQSKEDRVQRLQPDFLQSKFYLPEIVWHEVNKGGGRAVWQIDLIKNEIQYRPLLNDLKQQRDIKNSGQAWRAQGAILQKNEDGELYDLTRLFINQYLFFPRSKLRDLIDAVSRVYDLDPVPAVHFEAAYENEPVYYPDA